MKQRIYNSNSLEFYNDDNSKKGEIKISGSDVIINPIDSNGTVIFGEAGTINDIEIGAVGTTVDFTFLGGGTLTSNGNTLTLGESGDTVDLSNATIGTITASIFKGGQFIGDGSGLTNTPSTFTHITASGNISASGTGSFSRLQVGTEALGTYVINAGSGYSKIGGVDIGSGTIFPTSIRTTTIYDKVNTTYSSIFFAGADRTITFMTSGSNRMKIDSDGNVGIGTTTPGTKLHVGAGSSATVDAGYQIVAESAGIAGIQILSATNQSGRVVFGDSGDNDIGMIKYDHTDNSMGFRTNGSGNERMRITSAGNVGIGNSNPQARLHVDAGTTNTVAIFQSTDDKSFIRIQDDTTNAHLIAKDNLLSIGASSSDYDKFNVNISDGKVGMGTSSPSAKLHVVGDAIITGTLTAQEFHTEFVSASIMFESGSTKFGDTSDDTHQFTGSIFVSSSGTIGPNSDAGIEFGDGTHGNESADITIFTDTNGEIHLKRAGSNKISIQDNGIDIDEELHVRDGSFNNAIILSQNGYITASGNISASGQIFGNSLKSDQYLYLGGDVSFFRDGVNILRTDDKLHANSDIHLSTKLINRSQTSNYFQFGTNTQTHNVANSSFTGHITASGNINGASMTVGTNTVYNNSININNSGAIRIGNAEYISKSGNDLSLFQGKLKIANVGSGATFASHITASGNISASGDGIFDNVGIGTTPAQPLHVAGNARVDGDFFIIESNPQIFLSDTNHNSDFSINLNGGLFKITDTTNNADRITLDSTGKFGIGTTTPSTNLVVSSSGGSGVATQILVHNADDGSGNTGASAILESSGWGEAFLKLGGHQIGATGGDLDVRSATDLVFKTNGDNARMYISSSGNVGIGTTSPNVALDVSGEIAIRGGEGADDARMYFRASDNSNRFTIETDLDGTTNNDILGFRSVNNDNILVLKGNGNVGIGTTTPPEKLTVEGNISASGTITSHNSILDGSTPSILLKDTTLDTTHRIISNNSELQIKGDQAIELFANNTSSIYIASDGDVGIGTDAPGKTLDIRTNGVGDGMTLATSTPKTFAQIINGNSESFPYGKFTMNYGDTTPVQIVALSNELQFSGGYTTGGKISFRTATTERMRLTDTGLGIGTTAPTEKLQVQGNISASGALQLGATVPIKLLVNGGAANDSSEFRNGGGEFKIYSGRTTGAKHQSFVFASGDNYTSGATRMVITGSNGNVGIGTTTPTHKLDVNGNMIADGYNVGNTANYIDIATGLRLRSNSDGIRLMPNGTDAGYIKHTGISFTLPITASGNISASGNITATNVFLPGSGKISFDDSLDGSDQFIQGLDHNITIDGDNNVNVNADVAVNLNTPLVTAEGNISSSGTIIANKIGVGTSNPTSTAGSDNFIQIYGAVDSGLGIKSNNADWEFKNVNPTGDLSIYSAGSAKVTFEETGNVGIGTTAPTEKLQVTGNISASGDIMGVTGSFDYVKTNKLQVGAAGGTDILSIDGGDLQLENGKQITFADIGDGNTGRVKITGNEDTDIISMHVDNSNTKNITLTTTGVGIGKLTPGEKLEVVGNISASGTIVGSNLSGTNTGDQTSVTGNAGTVTNGVYVTGNQSIGGNKTFSGNTVVGVINPTEIAYRATVTSDHNFNGTTLSGDNLGTAQGVNVAQGHLVYLSTAGRWEKTDSDALATSFGMLAIQAGEDQTAQLVVNGLYNLGYNPGGSRGDPLYISGTVGLITSTAPTGTGDIVRIVGYKMHATSGLIYFNPDQTWVELA